jgi:hypothetical protein
MEPRKPDVPIRPHQPIGHAKCRGLGKPDLQADQKHQEVRIPFIVGIQEGDKRSRRFSNASVPCSRSPAILLGHEPHTRIWATTNNVTATIRRTVVHDDDFKIPKRLAENRIQGPRDVRGLLV